MFYLLLKGEKLYFHLIHKGVITQKVKTIAGDLVITVGGQINYYERRKGIDERCLKSFDMDRYKGEQI